MALIPTKTVTQEIEVKKSRFIGKGYPINSPEEGRELLKLLKQEFSDSRHVCYGFVWGKNSTHMGMGDDGEPNGTAGRPILEVIKGSGIENILVAVIRYFGGIKLGTGGLVKAYTDIAKLVVESIETVEHVEMDEMTFSIPYNLYDKAKVIITENNGIILREDFSVLINVDFSSPREETGHITAQLMNLTRGRLSVTKL